jgi:hypothetical protein
MSEWHIGEITSCQPMMAEAISLAKELNDTHTLAVALLLSAIQGHLEGNPAKWHAWHRI